MDDKTKTGLAINLIVIALFALGYAVWSERFVWWAGAIALAVFLLRGLTAGFQLFFGHPFRLDK